MRHERSRSKASRASGDRRVQSRAFEFDHDLRWFFVEVGKGGERTLRSPQDLRRWLRLQRAITGLWRLCLYFTNPRGFARPLLSSIVEDEENHGAHWLYGLSPDQRAERFHREDRELVETKMYAMRAERRLTNDEAYAVMGLDKEYERYRARRQSALQ